MLFVSPLALLAGPAWADGAVAAGDQPAYLEGVVVTAPELRIDAGKLDAAVIETPQAVSVVRRDQFIERGAQSVQETLRYTAGVVAEAYGNDGRSDYSFVRGVEAQIYTDGLRQTFGYYIPRLELETLSQVEVLKGPGGSLYGAGTVGGLINQTSKRPQFSRGGEISASYGSFDRFQATADFTGPLNASETLAGRIAALVRDSGTQTDYVDDDRILVAPSLTWKPTVDTTITVLGRYQRDRTGTISTFLPSAATLFAAPGKRLPFSRYLGEPDFEKYDSETLAVSLLAEQRIGQHVTLRSNSRYTDATLDYQSIYPDSYSNPAQPFIDPAQRRLNRYIWAIYPDMRVFTTDNHAQFDVATGPLTHRILAGVDYARFKQESSFRSGLTTSIDAYEPAYGDFTIPDLAPNADEVQTQLGFYAQDQISWDRISVLLGARRDKAKTSFDGVTAQSDTAWTYRAAVMVDLEHGVSPYVSYSESFQPVSGTDVGGRAFKPTTGTQWEAGIKWAVGKDALITLAAYEIKERNRLTGDPTNPNFSVQTGEAKLRGIEAEAQGRWAGFDVNAAVTFADTEITESNNAAEVGQRLAGAVNNQASLFAARTFTINNDVSLRLGGGVRYVGSSSSGDVKTPDYTLGDLYAAVGWQDWLFSVNATNITDKHYYSSCLARGDCFLGVRRSIVGTIRRKF
jgi:iron complex outermembrane receptor protein